MNQDFFSVWIVCSPKVFWSRHRRKRDSNRIEHLLDRICKRFSDTAIWDGVWHDVWAEEKLGDGWTKDFVKGTVPKQSRFIFAKSNFLIISCCSWDSHNSEAWPLLWCRLCRKMVFKTFRGNDIIPCHTFILEVHSKLTFLIMESDKRSLYKLDLYLFVFE